MKTGLGSTSPPIVRVRLVDSHGYSAVRCVRSDRLIEAIALENGLRPDKAGYDQAIAMALSSRDHSFRFVHPAARGVMSGSGTTNSGLTKSCELIAQGKSVVWIKTRGTIAEGPHFPLADRAR